MKSQLMIGANSGSLCEPISGRSWDRSEVQRQIALRVSSYQVKGLTRGDRVFFHIGNCLEFFAELIAVWRLGGCAVPMELTLTPFEIDKLAKRLLPRFAIFDDTTDSALVSVLPDVTIVHTSDHPSDGKVVLPLALGVLPQFDDDALILFTSGSTGRPKGVLHSHRSLCARYSAFEQCLGTSDFRRTLCVLSTSHMQGLVMNALYPWLSGRDLFVTSPFDTTVLMTLGKLIDQHNISFLSSTPSMWKLVLSVASPPENGSLKRIHLASAPLSKDIWEQIQRWAGINSVMNTYGTTEVGSSIAGTPSGNIIPESGLIGSRWGCWIKIMKSIDNSDGSVAEDECMPGESGSIWIKSPGMMKCYTESEDFALSDLNQEWCLTGDIGTIDEHDQLFIWGRESDAINKGGLKINPIEIDDVIQQFHHTDDVCTFRYRDDLYGENVGIAVVLCDQRPETIRDLNEWVDSHLAAYKHPAKWYLLDQLPRNSNAKINRESLSQLCDSKTPLDFSIALKGIS